MYKNADTTGVNPNTNGAIASLRSTFPGSYYTAISVTTGAGFATGVTYNVVVSGTVAGVTRHRNIGTFYAVLNNTDDLSPALNDVYFADINYNMDDVNFKDEFTVCWFRNGNPVSGFTQPKITIFRRSDGTLFLSETNMSGIGPNFIGAKYDTVGSSNRLLEGEAYLVKTSAFIESGTRNYFKLVSRDARIN